MRSLLSGNNKRAGRGFLFVLAAAVLLNLAAWSSTAFCDWYIENLFPLWVNISGRITGIFPFSVGEWMIAAGLLLLAAALILGVARLLHSIVYALMRACSRPLKLKQESLETERGVGPWSAFRRFSDKYFYFFAWVLSVVCLVMTLNCFILYHVSPFSDRFLQESDERYDPAELVSLYNRVAQECNSLAGEVERSEGGEAVYIGAGEKGISSRADADWRAGLADMADEAIGLMQSLGERYPQLEGWYPRPKAMFFSDFMCQQKMQGYYFPFSMEANYNEVMYILNLPSTMCHELSHLRGFLYEDEANFIGYLACVQSENAFFRYAGVLSVLNYLYHDIRRLERENPKAYAEVTAAVPLTPVSEQVWEDNIFVSEAEWERINGKALIETAVVEQATDAFIDTTLKVNGISDGKISYSRVVELLLRFYRLSDGKGL